MVMIVYTHSITFFLPHSSHATYFSIFNRLEVDELRKFLKYRKFMDIEMALKNHAY